MKSVSEQVREHIEKMGVWINGGDLERMTFLTDKGTRAKPSNISKRLRELWTAEKIEKDLRDGSIWYHFKVPSTAEIGGKMVDVFAQKKQKEQTLL